MNKKDVTVKLYREQNKKNISVLMLTSIWHSVAIAMMMMIDVLRSLLCT